MGLKKGNQQVTSASALYRRGIESLQWPPKLIKDAVDTSKTGDSGTSWRDS